MPVTFVWKCSYQNELEYQVVGDLPVRSIEVYSECTHGLLDYQRKIYNGDAAEFERTMVARQGGVLIRYVEVPYNAASYWNDRRWTQSFYQAFVQWLKDDHARQLEEMARRRVRYGYTLEEYPVPEPRPIPRPIYYDPESKGYQVEPWFEPQMAAWESWPAKPDLVAA